jgi:hypothetical protein
MEGSNKNAQFAKKKIMAPFKKRASLSQHGACFYIY